MSKTKKHATRPTYAERPPLTEAQIKEALEAVAGMPVAAAVLSPRSSDERRSVFTQTKNTRDPYWPLTHTALDFAGMVLIASTIAAYGTIILYGLTRGPEFFKLLSQ